MDEALAIVFDIPRSVCGCITLQTSSVTRTVIHSVADDTGDRLMGTMERRTWYEFTFVSELDSDLLESCSQGSILDFNNEACTDKS